MELTLQEILAIVEGDFVREMWGVVAIVSLHLMAFLAVAWIGSVTGATARFIAGLRRHPVSNGIAIVLAIPLIIYAATKKPMLNPQREQCDYRVGSEVDVTDGWLKYGLFTGTMTPTNLDVVCCNGATTNNFEFTHTNQFYYETVQYRNLDFDANPLWFRDSETNDWVKSVIDVRCWNIEGSTWVYGWRGAIAHTPDYGDPKNYRFWFMGPEENLPEKIIEGGVEIKVDFYYRDAHHVHIEFHTEDPKLTGATFVLQVRTVINGDLLGDWQTIASTTNGVFDVTGDFVSKYNRLRIYADKEEE